MIPVSTDGVPCPLEPDPARPGLPATGPLLRDWAQEWGWRAGRSPAGAPAYRLPGGGALSFEPGGQLEYSSPAYHGVDALLAHVSGILAPLAERARGEGIRLLARGMDPRTPVAEARLLVDAERYRRMAAHYDRRGPAGRRMMRQTAALHVNLDLGMAPLARWRAANRLAPALTALFANSPRAEGSATGHRSTRQLQWRQLDPGRTGLPAAGFDPCGGDEAVYAEYLAFALNAEAFLLGPEGIPARPFREWLGTGAGLDDWRRHLTTLFPEVRPRGYLELRCVDALPLRWYGAPLALSVGVLYAPNGPEAAIACLPEPTSALLERAGRLGLADPDIAAAARTALDLAEAGLEGMTGVADARDTLRAFRRTFSDRGHDPGHADGDELRD